MKHLLSLLFIIIFNFSAFAQIDTISYEATTIWYKTYFFANCEVRIEDCIVWRLVAKIDVENPKTKTIDEYIFIRDNTDDFIDSLSFLSSKEINLMNKKIFIDAIRNENSELEKVLIEKCKSSDNIYFMGEIDRNDLTEDWLYVFINGIKEILIIDLKTNRVIEKIELEPK